VDPRWIGSSPASLRAAVVFNRRGIGIWFELLKLRKILSVSFWAEKKLSVLLNTQRPGRAVWGLSKSAHSGAWGLWLVYFLLHARSGQAPGCSQISPLISFIFRWFPFGFSGDRWQKWCNLIRPLPKIIAENH
jgi:hypothetical protein